MQAEGRYISPRDISLVKWCHFRDSLALLFIEDTFRWEYFFLINFPQRVGSSSNNSKVVKFLE